MSITAGILAAVLGLHQLSAPETAVVLHSATVVR
jgi:hypothetical protein